MNHEPKSEAIKLSQAPTTLQIPAYISQHNTKLLPNLNKSYNTTGIDHLELLL